MATWAAKKKSKNGVGVCVCFRVTFCSQSRIDLTSCCKWCLGGFYLDVHNSTFINQWNLLRFVLVYCVSSCTIEHMEINENKAPHFRYEQIPMNKAYIHSMWAAIDADTLFILCKKAQGSLKVDVEERMQSVYTRFARGWRVREMGRGRKARDWRVIVKKRVNLTTR